MVNLNAEQKVQEEPGAASDAPVTPSVAPSNAPPFFILGSQRSGTTMLRLMLNNHRNLCIPHESAFITLFYPQLAEYGDISSRSVQEKLLEDVSRHRLVERGKLITSKERVLDHEIHDYRSFIEAVFSAYAEQFGKSRWGDKTPFYTGDVDVIRKIFPDSKIVHLVRDGRDVMVSQKNIEWMSQNFVTLARDWKWKTTLMHKIGNVIGDDFLEVRYEDLVRQPEEKLREICSFLGEDYDPEILTYADEATDVVPDESLKWHRNSVKLPDPRKIGAWQEKLTASEKILFDDVAGDTLELFGYDREPLRHTPRSLLTLAYYTLIRRY